MTTVLGSERDALKVIRELEELGKVKVEAVGKELGFSGEYATVLCRSLWKNGFIRGTTITGYEITEKGEKLLLELEKP
ncbi:hypothetical protein HQ584_02620 [Patescibacteria group bacterium]|nr:hypothetical protein [Patescibacteria group bacterium]